MQELILDYWGAFVGLVGIVGVWIAWRQWRGGPPQAETKTENVARGSKRVTQAGGGGTTKNTAVDSEDVDQRG